MMKYKGATITKLGRYTYQAADATGTFMEIFPTAKAAKYWINQGFYTA